MTNKRRAKPPVPVKKQPGQIPPHEPTEAQRFFVANASAEGVPQERIAKRLGIDEKTLRRHYAPELDRAHESRIAAVRQTAFEMAIRGDTPAMTIFVLKTQAGWREPREDSVDTTVNLVIHRGEEPSTTQAPEAGGASVTVPPEGA